MWIIARSARRRPTLMHKMVAGSMTLTACGLSVIGWSRAYFDTPIPQVQCLRCKSSA